MKRLKLALAAIAKGLTALVKQVERTSREIGKIEADAPRDQQPGKSEACREQEHCPPYEPDGPIFHRFLQPRGPGHQKSSAICRLWLNGRHHVSGTENKKSHSLGRPVICLL